MIIRIKLVAKEDIQLKIGQLVEAEIDMPTPPSISDVWSIRAVQPVKLWIDEMRNNENR
jgi:hypothetical protein